MGGIAQGVGTVAAAGIQARAQNKATASQERATREALAFSKEQEVARKANYDRAYSIWDASRQELMRRYGITLPPSTAPNPAAPNGALPRVGKPVIDPGDAMARQPQPGATIGDLAQRAPDWADWGRYNLGGGARNV